jgi:hypothetical protein
LKTSSVRSCMLGQLSDHISGRDSCLAVQRVAQTTTFDFCFRLVELFFFRYVFDGRALSRVPWTGVLCMRASLLSQINGCSSAGCFTSLTSCLLTGSYSLHSAIKDYLMKATDESIATSSAGEGLPAWNMQWYVWSTIRPLGG